MIRIEVSLFATLRKYNPAGPGKKSIKLEVEEGTDLENLFKELKLPRDEIKTTFVNNRRQSGDYVLQDGDKVGIFPAIAGG